VLGPDGTNVALEDYECLRENTYLNDKIIDFYLQWLHNEKMSEMDRKRTHIFSVYFYEMLTSHISKSEVRSSWTKNVDLIAKEFIVVPIHEKDHWFVAVICLSNLDGKK
jgi:Ulp1 family protease